MGTFYKGKNPQSVHPFTNRYNLGIKQCHDTNRLIEHKKKSAQKKSEPYFWATRPSQSEEITVRYHDQWPKHICTSYWSASHRRCVHHPNRKTDKTISMETSLVRDGSRHPQRQSHFGVILISAHLCWLAQTIGCWPRLFWRASFFIDPKVNGTFYIGRAPDANISSPTVYLETCQSVVVDGETTLYDLSSSNGCFVNARGLGKSLWQQVIKFPLGCADTPLCKENDQIRLDAHSIRRTLSSGKNFFTIYLFLSRWNGSRRAPLEQVRRHYWDSTVKNLPLRAHLDQWTRPAQELGKVSRSIGYVPQEDITSRPQCLRGSILQPS